LFLLEQDDLGDQHHIHIEIMVVLAEMVVEL
jgi:hypothetical protein